MSATRIGKALSTSRIHATRWIVDEKCLGDGGWVGKTGGLDDDAVELSLALYEVAHDPDQIAAHGAADAPVVAPSSSGGRCGHMCRERG